MYPPGDFGPGGDLDAACFGTAESAVENDAFVIAETRHPVELRTPRHRHDVILLHYVLDGCYEESVRGRKLRLQPGELLLKPAETEHWNDFRAAGSLTLRIGLRPSAFPELTERLPGRVEVARGAHLAQLARRARRELAGVDALSPLVGQSLVLELFAAIARAGGGPGPGERPALARAGARILDEEFRERHGLASLARRLDVGRSVLARAFRAEHGCTVGDYLRRRRVEHVAEALRSARPPSLSALALEAGFADQSHMTRVFKAHYGRPPGAWGRSGGEGPR